TEHDASDPRVTLHVINTARVRDGYTHQEVDSAFRTLVHALRPDIVHFGHLSHLSTSLVLEAHASGIPIVFTLHDYWLMCPRGQFIQISPSEPADTWALCHEQEDHKCAERCYSRYYSGAPSGREEDLAYWSRWIARRMAHVREVCKAVDLFIAPSRFFQTKFRDEFGIPSHKLVYLDYGFHVDRLRGRQRTEGEPFTFGYTGTHTIAKGVHHLIEAFAHLSGKPVLRIWGRYRGTESASLMSHTDALPSDVRERVEWKGEYSNGDIVPNVLNQCDAIVVPSIWAENSPLVIHEALQARVPVVTADYGGMAEYIHHEVNGLLFKHRNPKSLSRQMQRLVDAPEFAIKLGKRGYLQSEDGNVPTIEKHTRDIEELYASLIRPK
ncbi:MAG: glycosyltransferase, partial [Bacteroidota bacterium]